MSAAVMNSDLARFSRELNELNLMPLWERKTPMQPGSPCVPMIWRYKDLRPLLMRAADLIPTRAAERRVLVFENPGLRNTTYITNSLYAGRQRMRAVQLFRPRRPGRFGLLARMLRLNLPVPVITQAKPAARAKRKE